MFHYKNLTFDFLDYTKTFVFGSTHGTLQFFFHTFDETLQMKRLFTAFDNCQIIIQFFNTNRALFHTKDTDLIFNMEFIRELEKRPRRNPLGEDVYLLPDGSIVRDEDKIIAAQRIWKEAVYAPGGKMYLRVLSDWKDLHVHEPRPT